MAAPRPSQQISAKGFGEAVGKRDRSRIAMLASGRTWHCGRDILTCDRFPLCRSASASRSFCGVCRRPCDCPGCAAVISASTALREAAERQLSQAAHQMSERLDLHMFERLGDITTAAGMKTLFSGEDRDAQRALLERLQRAVPNYAWIGLAGPDGRVLVSTSGLLEGEDVSSRPWFAAGRQGPAALDVHEAKLLQRFWRRTSPRCFGSSM